MLTFLLSLFTHLPPLDLSPLLNQQELFTGSLAKPADRFAQEDLDFYDLLLVGGDDGLEPPV